MEKKGLIINIGKEKLIIILSVILLILLLVFAYLFLIKPEIQKAYVKGTNDMAIYIINQALQPNGLQINIGNQTITLRGG